MKDFILYSKELKNECIDVKELMNDSTHSISCTVFEELLFNDKNYDKLKRFLLNSNIYEIRIFKEFDLILKSSKIAFLESCLLYLKKYNYNNIKIYDELTFIYSSLNFINYIDTKKYNKIVVDNKEYNILILKYYELLDADNIEELLKKEEYDNIPIEHFVYGLINYFENNKLFYKYNFPAKIKKRYLELKQNKLVDFESLNKILSVKDKVQKKVKISNDIYDIISKKYDDNGLKNIIKVYLELCKMFSYDEEYYINPASDDSRRHDKVSYISYVNKRNNKIVCYEFPEIFGFFLNLNHINYEIIGGNKFYGFNHNYLIFRYHKFLIRIEPIKTVYNSDFTNIKIGRPLIGITCLNENEKTKEEFNNILSDCYQPTDFSFNEYLPANKIYNDKEIDIDSDFKDYLVKIDLVIKKINDLHIGMIEKSTYFKELMKSIFTKEELEKNIFYSVVTDHFSLVYIIIINPDILNHDDNIYLIYRNNKLSIIDKDELREMFYFGTFMKLKNQEIPGIDKPKKRS